MSNHISLSKLLAGDIVPPTGCSTDQSFSLLLVVLKRRKKGARDQSRASVGLLLFSPTTGMHIRPSPLPPPPLLSFITQLSFVGLIRLYLVWAHWGENFWGSMWKGKERGKKFEVHIVDLAAELSGASVRHVGHDGGKYGDHRSWVLLFSPSCLSAFVLMCLWA